MVSVGLAPVSCMMTVIWLGAVSSRFTGFVVVWQAWDRSFWVAVSGGAMSPGASTIFKNGVAAGVNVGGFANDESGAG